MKTKEQGQRGEGGMLRLEDSPGEVRAEPAGRSQALPMQADTRLQEAEHRGLSLAYLLTLLPLTLLVKPPCSGSFWKLLEQKWQMPSCPTHQCVLGLPRANAIRCLLM